MITFERRQRLMDLLRKEPGLRVPELALRLSVSEATIRNDLNVLAKEGQLVRLRGGARLMDNPRNGSQFSETGFIVNEIAKRQIARWAADLVEDRDSIFLDSSTTVSFIAEYLHDRRNLTVITNSLKAAQRLASNPSNTVILVGGALHPDGTYATGLLAERFLQDLHVQTAFISCSGFTPEAGLTEMDIHEAHLKSRIVASANATIALIDSTKFGKRDLTPFARTEQLAHIFTDSQLDHRWIEQLKQSCVTLTVCAKDAVSVLAPCSTKNHHYRIGFANLSEQIPFCVDVRRSLERAAKEAGNIDLILADNQLNPQVAWEVAERFASQDLDLVIEYQIDEQMGNRIMDRFRQAGIPVIAVDIPMMGATFFGVDNYRAGYMGGVELGRWVQERWDGVFDRLLVLEEPRTGALPAARIQGQLDGLQSLVGPVPTEKQIYLNSGNTSEVSKVSVLAALKQLPHAHRLAVISFNDDAAFGALMAARQAQREEDIVIIGQGADRRTRDEIAHPNSRLIGSTSYTPERYGDKLIHIAQEILAGEPVPPAVYVDHVFITKDNIANYYPESVLGSNEARSSVNNLQASLP